jgi:hypothetical protein
MTLLRDETVDLALVVPSSVRSAREDSLGRAASFDHRDRAGRISSEKSIIIRQLAEITADAIAPLGPLSTDLNETVRANMPGHYDDPARS